MCQISPRGSHESNGDAERTLQQVRRMARVYLAHVRQKTGSVFPSRSPWWAWALRHADVDVQQISCSCRYRDKAVFQNAAQSVRSTWCAFAGASHAVSLRLLVGQELSDGRTHCGEQSWCVSRASGLKIDRGLELVGWCRHWHGMDSVANSGDNERETSQFMTMNEPVWNAPPSTTPCACLDPSSETYWRRFERSGAAKTCWRGAREVTSTTGGRELCESTSNGRSNAARPRRRHLLAFRHHPLLLRRSHLQSICLERQPK